MLHGVEKNNSFLTEACHTETLYPMWFVCGRFYLGTLASLKCFLYVPQLFNFNTFLESIHVLLRSTITLMIEYHECINTSMIFYHYGNS